MAYCSVNDVRTELKISKSVDDDLLSIYCEEAQSIIDAYCHRSFEARDETRYYNPLKDANGRTLFLDDDLLSVTTLTNGDGSVISSSDFTLLPVNRTPKRKIHLKLNSSKYWTWIDDPVAAISVEGSWGFASTAPANIARAAKRLAAYLYRERETTPESDRAIVSGGIVIAPAKMPKSILDILAPYRIVYHA